MEKNKQYRFLQETSRPELSPQQHPAIPDTVTSDTFTEMDPNKEEMPVYQQGHDIPEGITQRLAQGFNTVMGQKMRYRSFSIHVM